MRAFGIPRVQPHAQLLMTRLPDAHRVLERGSVRARARTQEFRDVAKHYPMIKAEEMIVDNTCMQLAGRPSQFDVMARPPPCPQGAPGAAARRAHAPIRPARADAHCQLHDAGGCVIATVPLDLL